MRNIFFEAAFATTKAYESYPTTISAHEMSCAKVFSKLTEM